MKTRILAVIAFGIASTISVRAQFTANSQTNVISGVTSNWTGNGTYVVGSNTFLDTLIIQNGTLSDGSGYIGYEPGGSNNLATVNSGGVWSNQSDLIVGFKGAGNELLILNGGVVSCSNGTVGVFPSASNNTAVVSGSNSLWNIYELIVGSNAANSTLVITNGGRVVDAGALIGTDVGGSPSASVLVTGTNSVWNSSVNVLVSVSDSGPAITIANGAQFFSGGVVQIGRSAGASDNIVLVTDPGSTWSNTTLLQDGAFGSRSQFVVSNGATAYSGSAVIGPNVNVFSNSAVVTGPGSVWTVGGSITVADSGLGASLVVSNGGVVVAQDEFVASQVGASGALIVAGGTNKVFNSLQLGQFGGTGTVTLTTGALFVTNATATAEVVVNANCLLNLGVGTFKTDNLIVTNGGTVQYAQPYLVDNASLSVAGGTAQLNSNLTVASAANTTGTVSLTAGSFTVTNATVNIGNNGTAFGTGGVAKVTVSGGLFQAVTVVVGDNFDSHSSFTVAGIGHVVIQGGLRINGNHTTTVTDNGTLEVLVGPPPLFEDPILNNRIVVASGADGTMLVSNGTVNAPEMVIGLSTGNTGSLVMNGGVMSLSSNLLVGLNTSATGVVMISGGTLTATNGTFGIGSTGGVARVTVSGGLVQAASVLVSDNFGNPSSFTVAGSGHVVVQGGLRINGNHTTTINGGTLEVLVGPPPLFEDPFLRNRIVVAYGADGTMIVSNGAVRTPELLVGSSVGNTGTLALPGGGTSVFSNMTVGFVGCASTGIVNVTGGSLYVTNGGTAVLEVRSGTFMLSAGTVIVDKLVITNACARLVHTGGALVYSQLVLDPNLSAVGDGIRNGWKQQYGFDPFDPNLANEDADGDGMSNLQEYLAGTDPTNSASAFLITSVVKIGNDVRVTWRMGSGKTNALQFANGANYTTNFADLFIVTNTLGTVTNYLDVGGATNTPSRYYRVRLVP